jgi:hypothetical protein
MRQAPPALHVVSVVLLAAACSTGGSDAARDECDDTASCVVETVPRSDRGNFHLVVSNQSFAVPAVVISVSIDDRAAAAGRFDVENQHDFVSFPLELSDGRHRLRATAEADVRDAEDITEPVPVEELSATIDVRGRQYGLVMFQTEADEHRLRFQASDEPFQIG